MMINASHEVNNLTFINLIIANANHIRTSYVIIYLLITAISSLIGICGNIMTIITFAGTKTLRETRNFFIINLASADLMVNGIVMPYSIVGTLVGKMYFDLHPLLCRFLSTVCAPGCLASMFTICWISCSRYFFICRYGLYLKYFSHHRTLLYIASIWLTCFLVHSPNHFGWGRSDKYAAGFEICTLDMEVFSYSMFYGCWMVGAYATTFYFYYKIYKSIRSSKLSRRMIAGGGKLKPSTAPTAVSTKNAESVTQSKVVAAAVTVKNDKTTVSPTSAMRHEIKFVKTSFKIFLLFVSFWSPTALLILMGENSYVPKAIYLYALWLAHSNSTMNFFIYYMDDKRFRVAMWAMSGRMAIGTMKNRVGNQDGITRTGVVEKR